MLRTIIIDAETRTRDSLAKLLARHCPQVVVVGKVSGVKEGINAIQSLKPDLVFLDVDLEDGTGIDLLSSLAAINFKIIFFSAGDKDLLQAFMLSGVDYLLKPVNPVDLKVAVKNAEANDSADLQLQLIALASNLQP